MIIVLYLYSPYFTSKSRDQEDCMESSECLSVSLITISIVGSSNPENDNVRGGPLLTPERRERR